MNEAEWLAATDPTPMLECLRGKASDRKLRLLVCAYFRRLYALADPRTYVIEVGERYADGQSDAGEVDRARSVVSSTGSSQSLRAVVSDQCSSLAYSVIYHEFLCLTPPNQVSQLRQPIRDIFGNPFRSVTFDAAWLTSDVVALATGIFTDFAFDRMPILADALQDAGCENDDILTHCRDEKQVHVRGCWVVDLVLGKS